MVLKWEENAKVITIVDYGLGNIQAFANIYNRLNIPVTIASTSETLSTAEKIILPGVGSFDWAMSKLTGSGMRECLDDLVLNKNRPVIGVCVGMQIMANRSDEGELQGLGWIDAEVKKFDINNANQKKPLPHMGWNDVEPLAEDSLFKNMQSPRFYFLHSYYFIPANENVILANTEYSFSFTSAVRDNNVFGTQFHPEKSHHWGIQLLKNFAEM